MVEAPFLRRDSSRRGGFTLIEVVVALAIFVFGAVAIIRIFPPALGVIQNSGDRLTAINLNRSLITRYTQQPELVPVGVYDPNPGLNWRKDSNGNPIVGSVNGSPRRNSSIPSSSINDIETEFNESALGHFKNIVGEKHLVPRNGVVLTQFPFVISPSVIIQAYLEDSISGATVTSTGTLSFTNATSDSSPETPYTLMPNDVVYATYKHIINDRIQGIDEEPHVVPSSPAVPADIQLFTTTDVANGVVKVRVRRPVPSASLSPQMQYGLVKITDSSLVGKTLSFDYTVSDWRWLVLDDTPTQTPADGAPSDTKKATNLPIKLLDDNQSPFLYTLLGSQTTTSPDLRSVSASTPLPFGTLVEASRKSGQVIFDTSSTPPTDTPQARVLFRTNDNWATQLSVAANYYKPFIASPSPEEWRDYKLNGVVGNNDGYIYLKPSEAGKTLRISYTYGPSTTPPDSSQDVAVVGRLVTVDNTIYPQPAAAFNNFAVGGVGVGVVSRLQLTDINGNPLPSTLKDKNGNFVPFHLQSIKTVEGVSIQSRTAWQDGNNFTQVSSVGVREVNN